jgi:Flp pilus assembly protein TadG
MRRQQKGYVLITMSLGAIAMTGALGMAVDLGRMFIAKSETQTFVDAASLAAATKLNGQSTGIAAAQSAVTALGNTWNLNTQTVSNPTMAFATTTSGPWQSNPSPATGYMFVRVEATVPVTQYFLPLITNQQSAPVYSRAVAGQIPITSLSIGLAPYTAVAPNPAASDFGFVQGNSYNVQWPQFNGSRSGCPANPRRCYNADPCPGDPNSTLAAVATYWGSSNNGYWGSSNNSEIYQQVLNLMQLNPVTVGDLITLTNGNKAAQAGALDTRTNQDNVSTNLVSSYLTNSLRNGRRLMAVPVVSPTASGTYVVGYASFLLMTNGWPSNYYQSGNGNDPFCALYVGPYVQGSDSQGANNGTGAFRVALVQ